MAEEYAGFSKDPSTKCGCVIVNPRTKRPISFGFNGFPSRIEDNPDFLNDRPRKYKLTIHSEMNAIIHSPVSLEGMSMFVTAPCCDNCAKHAVAAGIDHVYWIEPSEDFLSRWDFSDSIETFKLAGVNVTEVSREVYENNYLRR
jgi:dCMP deaminase